MLRWANMTVSPFPLATERLILRPHLLSDRSALLSFYSRPDVAVYLLEEPWTPEAADEKLGARIKNADLDGETGSLALIIELEGKVIGDVSLWYTDRERRVAEIGWVLDPEFGGYGYAQEAVSAVLKTSFARHNLHRVAAQMDARNAASAKLAKNVGMQHEASLRQDWWSKGEWTDTFIFGMLASDTAADGTMLN